MCVGKAARSLAMIGGGCAQLWRNGGALAHAAQDGGD